MLEQWEVVEEFPAYVVSNRGRVRREIGGRGSHQGLILKNRYNNRGYLIVDLCMNNKKRSRLVSRLVALAFIKNPKGLPEVNHKDGFKKNNYDWNLEWSTRAQNMQHMVDVLKHHATRKVFEAESPDGRIFIFDNLTSFAREHGLQRSHCVSVATGNRPHHRGWVFRHIEEASI